MMAAEPVSYQRDFFRLSYPMGWSVRETPLGLTEFRPADAAGGSSAPYPSGIALITIAETGMALEPLLRTGLYFITRDLRSPAIERLGEQRAPGDDGDDDDGDGLSWYRLLVRGRAASMQPHGAGEAPSSLDVVKRVALSRPGPGVLVLALYGPSSGIDVLGAVFESLLRSVRIVR